MAETIATITRLYIYPIKSMAGISVQEAHVGLDGILGDRQYAFIRTDQAATNSFPWMTAREDSRMLFYQPSFAALPTPEKPEPAIQVRSPKGEVLGATDTGLREELTEQSGHSLFLLKSARGIFDCQHISIFSLASARALYTEAEVAVNPLQFRANIYVEPSSGQAFDEEHWTDCLLQIGSEVLTGVTQRDPRCMMINLDLETGKQNPSVLKTVAKSHQGQIGIYANVIKPGQIRVGDSIRRLPNPKSM